MKIKPLGFYVLIEMIEVKEVSQGGIILQSSDVEREQEGCDRGYVRAIGPAAFRGFPGCDPKEYPPSHPFYDLQPHEIWGMNVGDLVEYRRYEGKVSGVEGCDRLRYIPDTQIIGIMEESV